MANSTRIDLRAVRDRIGLSQSGFADLMGCSVRTVQACEQGWRNPSPGVEKSAVLLLLAKRHGLEFRSKACWDVLGCSKDKRDSCLVYQTRQGHLCWLLSGNICRGKHLRTWKDKKETCTNCSFFKELLPDGLPFLPPDSTR